MIDKINEIWPGWHTVELIGRGAFGEVFKVKKEKLGEVFYSAVKVIRIPQDENEIREMMADGYTSQSIRNYYESIAEELMNEIELLEELKSVGNVVNIEEFDICEQKEGIGWETFIRMELLQNLNEFRRGREMTEREVVKLGVDICEALAFCEKSNIIHRDIKPSNIFVDKYGNFKLGDFGIARRLEKTQSTISQKGTEKYMAPEVYSGVMESSYNIDIYSLGLVMYQLLNQNKLPFEPLDNDLTLYKDKEKALQRRLKGEPLIPPINASKELGEIIIKACEADKNKRYQSAQEMKKQLLNWVKSGESNTVDRNLKEEGGEEEKQKRKIIDDKTESIFLDNKGKRELGNVGKGKNSVQSISKLENRPEKIHIVKKTEERQNHVHVKEHNEREDKIMKIFWIGIIVIYGLCYLFVNRKSFSKFDCILIVLQVIALLLISIKNSQFGALLCSLGVNIMLLSIIDIIINRLNVVLGQTIIELIIYYVIVGIGILVIGYSYFFPWIAIEPSGRDLPSNFYVGIIITGIVWYLRIHEGILSGIEWAIIGSQIIGLILIRLKNSNSGAVICMPGFIKILLEINKVIMIRLSIPLEGMKIKPIIYSLGIIILGASALFYGVGIPMAIIVENAETSG